MLDYPLAILKFTWSDTPWENGRPAGITYDDALINRLYLPLELHWGVAGYWRKGTFGQLNLEGSEVFPWRKLEGFPPPQAGAQTDRVPLIQQAITQGLAEQWPLHEFKGIVVLIGPRNMFQDAGAWLGSMRPSCLVQIGDDQAFCAHEMGHALGFHHTMGPHPKKPAPALDSYISRYCVMGEGGFAAPAALPPNGPPVGDGYWATMAPLPAAATLCAFLPDFRDHSSHVEQAGPLTPAFQRTVRLRARDLSRADVPHPVAFLLSVPGAPQPTERDAIPPAPPTAWVVELRRSAGWDRGFGSKVPQEGIVVHSLRPINEDLGENDFRPRAVFEGVFPLTPANTVAFPWGGVPASDVDARFGNGALTLRVEDVAPDLSWVEVIVGGSDLARQAAVFAEFHPAGYEHERDEEGFAEGVPIFVCGKGDYHYTRSVRRQRIRGTAVAHGYDQPEFSWRINGKPVIDNPLIATNHVTVNVTSRTPLPTGGETSVAGTAVLRFLVGSNTLEVLGDAQAGNYDLEIEVTVREKSATAANPASPVSAVQVVEMENVVITYESAYYEALDACIERVQDIDHRFSKSRRVGPQIRFRPTDSPERSVTILNRIRENVVAEGHGVLAEQIGGIIAAMAKRLQR